MVSRSSFFRGAASSPESHRWGRYRPDDARNTAQHRPLYLPCASSSPRAEPPPRPVDRGGVRGQQGMRIVCRMVEGLGADARPRRRGQSLDPGNRDCALSRFHSSPRGSWGWDEGTVQHGGGEDFEGRRSKATPTERHAETPLQAGALRYLWVPSNALSSCMLILSGGRNRIGIERSIRSSVSRVLTSDS